MNTDASIILLDGSRHRLERARFLPALHGERIRRYTGLMAQAAFDEIAEWEPGTTIDARDAAQSITLRIIVQAVFGIDDKQRCAEGIVKLFGDACGAVDVSGPAGERWWLTASFKPLRR